MHIVDLFERRDDSFRRWFAGSKVVDDAGNPKRMYHGTRNDVRAFDLTKASPTALYGPGFYFTDNPDVAGGTGGGHAVSDPWEVVDSKASFNLAGYAFQAYEFEIPPLTKRQMAHAKRIFLGKDVDYEVRSDIGMRQTWQSGWKAFNDGPEALAIWIANRAPRWMRERMKIERHRISAPNVVPVFLSIRNPFDMDAPASMELFRKVWDKDGDPHETFENATAGWRQSKRTPTGEDLYQWAVRRCGFSKQDLNKILMELGYDGIRHRGGNNIGTMGPHEVWIAFRPNQIKSIFAKRFDPNSENIDEELTEASFHLMNGESIRYLKNPSPASLAAFARSVEEVRGIIDGNDVYFWDAARAIHGTAALALGIAYHYTNRLWVMETEDEIAPDNILFQYDQQEWPPERFMAHPKLKRYLVPPFLFYEGGYGNLIGPEWARLMTDVPA